MKKVLFLTYLLIAGCSTMPKQINIPIAIPAQCPVPENRIVYENKKINENSNNADVVKSCIVTIAQYQAREKYLESLLASCKG